MRWPASASVLLLVLAGCANTVGGTAEPVTTALRVLPSEPEITDAVGNPLSTFGFQPFTGGVEILPDGYRTEADASPLRCVAVTDTSPRIVYEAVPVVDAARQSYFNWDHGVDSSGADAAAVVLATAGDAERVFAGFVQQWQQCDGTTVVKHLRGGGGDSVVDAAVGDVVADGSVLSATVRTQQGSAAPVAVYERALGIREATIVEVSLAITSSAGSRSEPHAEAVRVARVMLDKVGA